jgi:hypothetical protein
MVMEKPNCYKCEYRGTIPGDAHSCCKHPGNKGLVDNPVAEMIGILASVGRIAPIQVETKLNIKGNPIGIRRGWFNWPMNFDPIWLLECNGFLLKEIKEVKNDE